MSRCGAEHPEDDTLKCRMDSGPHAAHACGSTAWPNPEFSGPTTVAQLREIRSGKPQAKMAKVLAAGRPGSVLAEAAAKWDNSPWVREAVVVVTGWLREHPEEFTTAEQWWPLLDRPPEMRAMVRVVQRCLRSEYIEEVGAKRLRGVYRTRDGHEFSENKLVPIYRSRIASRS